MYLVLVLGSALGELIATREVLTETPFENSLLVVKYTLNNTYEE